MSVPQLFALCPTPRAAKKHTALQQAAQSTLQERRSSIKSGPHGGLVAETSPRTELTVLQTM